MPVDESFNFRRVSTTVTTSGSLTADQLATLADEGIQVLVNLNPDGGYGAVEGEDDIVRGQGVAYVYLPVDFAAPTHDDFEAFAAAMDAHEGESAHVHCAANYRVTAFCSLYALRRGWCTEDEANELVRSIWDPAEFPAWSTFIADMRARDA